MLALTRIMVGMDTMVIVVAMASECLCLMIQKLRVTADG